MNIIKTLYFLLLNVSTATFRDNFQFEKKTFIWIGISLNHLFYKPKLSLKDRRLSKYIFCWRTKIFLFHLLLFYFFISSRDIFKYSFTVHLFIFSSDNFHSTNLLNQEFIGLLGGYIYSFVCLCLNVRLCALVCVCAP